MKNIFVSMSKLTIYQVNLNSQLELPYADDGVHAGFPSPAQDYMENSIDLNRDLVAHPESTFYARVEGESMIDANLKHGDILVVDKALEVHDGDIAVCVVEGEFTVKYVEIHPDHVVLRPANKDFAPITINDPSQFEVWGVVTFVIHAAR